MAPPEPKSVENIFEAFGDLFGDFFAHGALHLCVTLELTDADAAAGCVREVAIQRHVPCTSCDGRGTKSPTSSPVPCGSCSGKGRTQFAQGFFMVQQHCTVCSGRGAVITDPCELCGGMRTITKPATVTVSVPAGIEHGATLRLAGEGSKGMEGTTGDLHVFVLVGGRPDPREVAFGDVPLEAELPRATVRTKETRMPWSALIVGALLVVAVLVLFAR